MTTRAPEGPLRVTSWLAGWVDYVIALTLVAGRRLRIPASRSNAEPVMLAAFAPAMAEQYGSPWASSEPRPQTGALVKVAEILMLSASFFIAAHLLAGGTATVSAPNLNPLGLLSEHGKAAQAQVVPAAPSRLIEVPAGSFAPTTLPKAQPAETAPAETVTTEAAVVQAEEPAVLAAPQASDTTVASVAPPPADAPAPTAIAEAVAPPPPAPAPALPPVAATLPAQYLTVDELRAAAVVAGWPAAVLPALEKVAWCESRYDARAEYLGARGLMQMMAFWFPAAGLDAANWADPVTNLRAAWFAYSEHLRITGDPWGPWTCKP